MLLIANIFSKVWDMCKRFSVIYSLTTWSITMKNDEKFEVALSDIIVKWEALSTTQKQEILKIVESSTNSAQSTEYLKLQSSFYLQRKSKR